MIWGHRHMGRAALQARCKVWLLDAAGNGPCSVSCMTAPLALPLAVSSWRCYLEPVLAAVHSAVFGVSAAVLACRCAVSAHLWSDPRTRSPRLAVVCFLWCRRWRTSSTSMAPSSASASNQARLVACQPSPLSSLITQMTPMTL